MIIFTIVAGILVYLLIGCAFSLAVTGAMIISEHKSLILILLAALAAGLLWPLLLLMLLVLSFCQRIDDYIQKRR